MFLNVEAPQLFLLRIHQRQKASASLAGHSGIHPPHPLACLPQQNSKSNSNQPLALLPPDLLWIKQTNLVTRKKRKRKSKSLIFILKLNSATRQSWKWNNFSQQIYLCMPNIISSYYYFTSLFGDEQFSATARCNTGPTTCTHALHVGEIADAVLFRNAPGPVNHGAITTRAGIRRM